MKLKSLCLLALFSFSYAGTNLEMESYVKEYNEDFKSENYSVVDYASENEEVQIELYIDKKSKDSLESGYVNKVVLCDLLDCKVYDYKPNEVPLVVHENKFYSEFKAKLNSGKVLGHMCSDLYNVCHDHVILDIEYNGQPDFEAKIMLHHESAIKIQKLTKSYI